MLMRKFVGETKSTMTIKVVLNKAYYSAHFSSSCKSICDINIFGLSSSSLVFVFVSSITTQQFNKYTTGLGCSKAG